VVPRIALLRDTCTMNLQVDDPAVSMLLGVDGPFAREVPNFAPRETQQRMADAVTDAIEDRDALVVEAGTGTGKTFAYLVPALLSGKRVVVSTGTRNLQDQLFHRDLPRVMSILGAKADVALLKGRANYLCKYRLQQTVESGQFKSRTQLTDLQKIREQFGRENNHSTAPPRTTAGVGSIADHTYFPSVREDALELSFGKERDLPAIRRPERICGIARSRQELLGQIREPAHPEATLPLRICADIRDVTAVGGVGDRSP